MGNHVFICYARRDQRFVLRFAARLKVRGVPVWLDQWDIPPGADWDQSIDCAIHTCAQFLIVLSPAAVASKHVRGELQTAMDENKSIVPVLRQACQIPRLLRLIQYVDFTGCDPEDEAALDRVGRTLGLPVRERQGEPATRHESRRGFYEMRDHQPGRRNANRQLFGGAIGGVLALGVVVTWFFLRPAPLPKPTAAVPVARTTVPASKTAFVRIDTQPSGCDVYQDGRRTAATPWQFHAPISSYVRAVLKCKDRRDEKVDFEVSELGNEYTYTPMPVDRDQR